MSGGHGIISREIIPAPVRVRPEGGQLLQRTVCIPPEGACPEDLVYLFHVAQEEYTQGGAFHEMGSSVVKIERRSPGWP